MSLIVEDGTGYSDSESYISVEDADTYHANRANALWAAASTPQKEAALRKATQYLDSVYDAKWRGSKNEYYNALSWPRSGAFDDEGFLIPSDEIPIRLQYATAELALRALSADLLPDAETDAGIRSESVTVGPIADSITYASPEAGRKLYHTVGTLVRPLISNQFSSEIVRG